jgi:pyruvate,water dikinase
MYMQLPEGMEIPVIPITGKQIISIFPNLIQVQRMQIQGRRRLPAYLANNPAWFNAMRTRIQTTASGQGLMNLWRREIWPGIKNGVWTVLGTVNHSMELTGKVKRELTSLVGPEDANVLIANLSDGGNLLPSLGPSIGLARVANGELSQADYLELYGHRGPNEFELSMPRPVEDPTWLNIQLEQYQKAPLDTREVFRRQQKAFDAARHRLLSRHPHQANRMVRRIQENARRITLREHARSEYVRDRWLMRVFALRASEVLNLGEDIFFLTLDEMLNLLSGEHLGEHLPDGLIASRRETYQRYQSLPEYPTLIRGQFNPFQWAVAPNRKNDFYDPRTSRKLPTSQTIQGISGSAGWVEGVARVITRLEEVDQFQAGEILVTRMTDISWTPLFTSAAAVVTDIGAPLSHAAIVARELGIPAVVGCQDATMRLQTGDRIRVDGNTGIVLMVHKEGQ